MSTLIICGDCLTVLRAMPKESIDCCITSPPFWGLRDYGVQQVFGGDPSCSHSFELKHRRPSRGGPHGFSTTLGGTNIKAKNQARFGQPTATCTKCGAWRGQLGLEPTPELYIEHLAEIFQELKRVLKKTGTFWLNIGDTYFGSGCGTNDYRTPASLSISRPFLYDGPRPQNQKKHPYLKPKSQAMIPERLSWRLIQGGWTRRNTIIWQKPNCMPSSAKDRFTVDFEYLYFFTKNNRYKFTQQIEPYDKPLDRWGGTTLKATGNDTWAKGTGQKIYRDRNMRPNPKGRNMRCVWRIPTTPVPIKGVHFATFPEKLCEAPIKAGSPEGGIVLDPFAGSGTVGAAAKKLGRHAILIDIKYDYCLLAKKRIEKASCQLPLI